MMVDDFPADLTKYSESPVFAEDTIPDGLRRDHKTKPGVWGRIVVLDGQLKYARRDRAEVLVQQCECATVWPAEPHHVTPKGAVTFKVEFYRQTRKTEETAA